MGTLTVVLEGMGLWMNRGYCWEVLFADISARRKDISKSEQKHEPGFIVESTFGNLDLPHRTEKFSRCGVDTTVYDLKDKILDFTSSGLASRLVGVRPDWMLPIPLSLGCTATDAAAALSTKVTGALRLPLGPLSRLTPFSAGPISLPAVLTSGVSVNVYTDYGTQWQADLSTPTLNFSVLDRTSKVRTPITLASGSGNIVIRVMNQTEDEWNKKPSSDIAYGDPVNEVLDLYELAGISSTVPSPTYLGPNLKTGKPPVPACPPALTEAKTATDAWMFAFPITILTNGTSQCPQCCPT
jgi:hypothetical protein